MDNLPLQFTQTSRTDNHHGRFQKVNQVQQHVPRVFGVQKLAGDGDVEVCPLE